MLRLLSLSSPNLVPVLGRLTSRDPSTSPAHRYFGRDVIGGSLSVSSSMLDPKDSEKGDLTVSVFLDDVELFGSP